MVNTEQQVPPSNEGQQSPPISDRQYKTYFPIQIISMDYNNFLIFSQKIILQVTTELTSVLQQSVNYKKIALSIHE